MPRHAFRSIVAAIAPVIVLCALSVVVVIGRQQDPPGPVRVLDATKPITYFIAEGKSGTGYRPADRQLARWAFDAWQRNAENHFRFAAAPESSALVRLYWAEADGSEYGEMQPLIIGGKRGAAVYIRPDVNGLGPDISQLATKDDLLRDSIVYLTCLHELGHALGLPHTQDFRDIMYFFGFGGNIVEYFGRYRRQLHTRADIASVSGLSDSDVTHIRAAYPGAGH